VAIALMVLALGSLLLAVVVARPTMSTSLDQLLPLLGLPSRHALVRIRRAPHGLALFQRRAQQGAGVLLWFVMLILGGTGPPPDSRMPRSDYPWATADGTQSAEPFRADLRGHRLDPVEAREYPAEQTRAWLLAPAVWLAPARVLPTRLLQTREHGECQVPDDEGLGDALHVASL
jgi:hypothetical protein